MTSIDRSSYKDLKRLLIGLPGWATREQREELVNDALFGHPIRNDIGWTNDATTSAHHLIETCAGSEVPTQDGKKPLCALLAEVRERGWTVCWRRPSCPACA